MKLITLVAGQSCTIRCQGKLRFKLFSGNADIAGVAVEPSKVITFCISLLRPLVLYTLEGCVFGLQPECVGDSKLTTEVSPLVMGTLLKHLKRGFDLPPIVNAAGLGSSTNSGGLRIVVAGVKGSGKYLAACAIVNTLNRSTGEGAILCDLTTDVDGQLSRLGCLGCIETHPEVPLWEGLQWSTYSASMMFFHGLSSAVVGPDQLPQFLVSAGSACESAAWMSEQKKDAPIVYVLPAFDTSISKEAFFRAVLDPVKPTHVVFTGDDDGSSHQSLERLFPGARLLYCGSVVSSNAESEIAKSEREQSAVLDYFLGTTVAPLGSSLMTLPLSSINFVSVESQQGGGVTAGEFSFTKGTEDETDKVNVEGSSSSSKWAQLVGRVCAVSFGTSTAEVPFANIAGLVVVSNVFPEANELEIISPSSDSFVPSPFFIVSNFEASVKDLVKL